jgi:hypothetical protein
MHNISNNNSSENGIIGTQNAVKYFDQREENNLKRAMKTPSRQLGSLPII